LLVRTVSPDELINRNSPQTWGFTRAYEVLIDRKLSSIGFNNRTVRPLAALQRLTGIAKSPGQLWKAASLEFRVPKAGDLMWRFLHNRGRTGKDLDWLAEELQICPIHRKDLIVRYVWLECTDTVAKAIWEELDLILTNLGDTGQGTRLIPPKTVNELIIFMAFSPFRIKGSKDRRWKVLYQTAVWCI
jgi:hypothetical protein